MPLVPVFNAAKRNALAARAGALSHICDNILFCFKMITSLVFSNDRQLKAMCCVSLRCDYEG
eukprot:1316895-Pleurochrysis_carterae.AAC.1